MEPHFVTIFEIGRKKLDWQMLTVPMLFLIGSAGFACWEVATRRRFKHLIVAWVFGFTGFVVGYGFYKDQTYGLGEAESALKYGQFSVVEGRITDFVAMPFSGHSKEQFTVSGVRFSYSDYLIQPCFNNTASHGGPIREEMWVRLSYKGNCILKIDLWESTDAKSSYTPP